LIAATLRTNGEWWIDIEHIFYTQSVSALY
jgi:hypothetical protein